MNDRALSGMRPTGNLHLGNYIGAIKQFLDLQENGAECFYFAADLHALTEVTGPTNVDELSIEAVRNYIACGVNPETAVLYRQSDVPEVSEITVLLGNVCSVAHLRRCTTYKGQRDNRVIAAMQSQGCSEADAKEMIKDGAEMSKLDYLTLRQLENQCSFGLLGYPVLMAADILAVESTLVPVGADQKQHVEMAKQFARTFNTTFDQEVFTIPRITEQSVLTVRGIDGAEKMGKSDGNTIALLEDLKSVRKKVMSIPTQSEPGGAMEDGTMTLFNLVEHVCPEEIHTDYLRRYHGKDGKFFGEMKKHLAEDMINLLDPIQQRYATLSESDVRDVLAQGAEKVRPIASKVLDGMRKAMGVTT